MVWILWLWGGCKTRQWRKYSDILLMYLFHLATYSLQQYFLSTSTFSDVLTSTYFKLTSTMVDAAAALAAALAAAGAGAAAAAGEWRRGQQQVEQWVGAAAGAGSAALITPEKLDIARNKPAAKLALTLVNLEI